MCGIFGYIGNKNNAANLVLEGLKTLEYRGYDSWGIAVRKNNKIVLEKHIGKIGDAKTILPHSNLGIGHTRWATHGGVTDENAHPHLDCAQTIAVVHNGIVENHQSIGQKLLKNGHKFASDTDTEVIVHLIEENLKKDDFKNSVRNAFMSLTGLNAIVVENCKTGEIVSIKNGSPLIIGKGVNQNYIASDASAIIPHTRTVCFLEDNELAVLNDQIYLYDAKSGKRIDPKFTEINWEIKKNDKGKFKHFLLKEINEQPHILAGAASLYREESKNLAKLIQNAKGTFMLGCGTASYAALAGTYLFSSLAKIHVNFSIASEFEYIEDYLTSKSLVIPISQSGETIDVLEPVMKAKEKGARIAAVVNVLGSTLYRKADYKFLLGAGIEKAVISTKAFISMYSLLLLTAYTIRNEQEKGLEILLQASSDLKSLLSNTSQIEETAKLLKNKDHVYIIGRGLSYVAALEAALKLKETAYIHAEGFAGGELKHGVIALIEKGTPCIVLAPNDETFDAIVSNSEQVKARGGFIIGIGPRNHKSFDIHLSTGDNLQGTFIAQITTIQLLSYYLAIIRGNNDPDKPRNLAKSVTVK